METRDEKRLRCWESVIPKGRIETQCPVCHCSTIRYNNTSGTTFQQMHIVSARQGGPHESWNLMPGCGCNQNMKHDNLLDWMGTRGNKRSLMRALFLRKYKSLVAPRYRSTTDFEQVANWVASTYHPLLLHEYRDWLLLLESDLDTIMYDDNDTELLYHTNIKKEPSSPQKVFENSEIKIEPMVMMEPRQRLLVVSPYFTERKRKIRSDRDSKIWLALRRMKPQYPHDYYFGSSRIK